MSKKLLLLTAGFAFSAWATAATAATAETSSRKDLQVFNDISKAVTRYVHFTVFDSVDASVKDGVVTLTGRVTMPFKKDDIEKRVARSTACARCATKSRCCRFHSSTIRSVIEWRERFTRTRTSGTTRSWPTLRYTSWSSTAA